MAWFWTLPKWLRAIILTPALGACALLMASHGVKGCSAGPTFHGHHVPSGDIHCRGLEHLWEEAGGDPGNAVLMAAIGMAESGGHQYAVSSAGAEGYWQIMPSVWGHWATFDPLGNARAAVHILRRQGLGAWSSYTNGSYAGRC